MPVDPHGYKTHLGLQIQAEAATTWRSTATATSDVVRGTDRLRAWSVTSPSRSLHAGVVIADHDREALERLARYGARPAFAHDRLTPRRCALTSP